MKKIAFFILFLIFVKFSFAQYYLTGVEPFSTSWRQIKTSQHRIIFPVEAEKTAIQYANILSVVDSVTPKSLQTQQKSFDIVIHNHSVLSNGFVVWAPKRMEVVTTPLSSINSQPWLTQLALHETRHTSQLFKLNKGLIKFSSYFLGQQVVGVSAGFVPGWFYEGDAVAFETATSNSGRGRQASFYQYYRTHLLTKTSRFSYDKWLLGSYRDKIPNHYNLGYQMVSYAKLKYGNNVWSNVLSYVSWNPYTLFPFYFGLKSETGFSRKVLFKDTFSNLDSLWRNDSSDVIKTKSLLKECKEYSDYRYPASLNDTLIVAYKESLSKIPSFVLINTKTKNEKVVLKPGYLTSRPSYFEKTIFWTEYLPHLRWDYLNYSIVKSINIENGRVRTISDKGKYFSPVYNPTDGLVYALSYNDDGSSAIVAFSGSGLRKVLSIDFPEIYQPFELCISNNANTIYVGVVTKKGKAVVLFDGTDSFKLIYGPTYRDIHSISAYEDFLFFSTTNGYKEDLFTYNVKNNNTYNILKSNYGSNDPIYSKENKQVYFSSYTIKGYTISKIIFDTTNTRVRLSEINDDIITQKLRAIESFNIDSISIPHNSYNIEKYRGIKTLVNIHSWAPFYFDPNQLTTGETQVKLGATIFSQNLTGSSVLTAGYGYDKASLARINYQYYGLYPVISYQFELSGNTPSVHFIDKTTYPRTEKQRKESTLSIYLPLKLKSNSFSTVLYPFFQMINSNDYFLSTNDSLYYKGFQRLNYRIYFSSLQKQAVKDILPRVGFVADINFQNAPFNRNNLGSIFSGVFSLYLPGISKNHSLLIKQSIQSQNIKRYLFSNNIVFPRGYLDNYSELYKSISFEYLLPIAYPDFACGSIAYFKRISLNTFYDYAENRDPFKANKQIDKMRSFGFEIFTDLNLLRTRYPIRLKYQQGWLADNLSPFNSFSVYIDFYGQ